MHYSRSKSAQQPTSETPSNAPAQARIDEEVRRGESTAAGGPLVLTRISRPPLSFDKETGEIFEFETPTLKPVFKNPVQEARKARYDLLAIAADILEDYHPRPSKRVKGSFHKVHRTVKCHKVRIAHYVQVHRSQEHKTAFYSGLTTCGSVWTCPVCSTKMCERRSHELRIAFNQAQAMGLQVSLWTFTAPHTAGDSIDGLRGKISKALTGFSSGSPFIKLRSRFGIIGRIKSLEVRHGVNGWHPHFHLIFFSKKSLLDRKDWALSRWQSMCVKAGLSCPNEYGLDIRDGSKAGEYINKFSPNGEIRLTNDGDKVSWDLADEATKGMKKGSNHGSLSPWGILDLAGTAVDKKTRFRYKCLFLDYAKAMHEKPQLEWGNGLKDYFGVEEKSDEDLLAEDQDKAKLLAHLTPEEWKEILLKDQRATLLSICESGGQEALVTFLHGLKCNRDGDRLKFQCDFYARL
jgi:hypothetical protein